MAGTDRFLAKNDIAKGCSLRRFEECHAEAFLEHVKAQCGCLPWSLSSLDPQEVRGFHFDIALSLYQEVGLCTPAKFSCPDNFTRETFGCLNSCTGLYADVFQAEDTEALNSPRFQEIISEYERYKASFARNIQFNGEAIGGGE